MYYGLLPFEAVRTAAFLLLIGGFAVLCWLYRSDALPLHWATLTVLAVATVESIAWLAAYAHINKSGQPYCCPYPGQVSYTTTCLVMYICVSYTTMSIV
jgi:hypothetical protein